MKQHLLIEAVATAIATREGFFDRARRGIEPIARRLNNPLCLKRWKKPDGSPYPETNGYVEFSDEQEGWRAGRAQVKINIVKRRLTFYEFFAGKRNVYDGFTNAREKHDPLEYAAFVADHVCRYFNVEARCGRPECECALLEEPRRCVHTTIISLAEASR